MKRNAKSHELARARVIKERGAKCEWCGWTDLLELHHIREIQYGGTHDNANLLLLCSECHLKAHGYKRNPKVLERYRQLGWAR